MVFTGEIKDLGLSLEDWSKETDLGMAYILAKPLSPDQEKDLLKYDNLKLIKNGAKGVNSGEYRDVLYYKMAEELGELEEEVATEDLDEEELMTQLDKEIFGLEESEAELDKYASVTAAMASLNSQILLYKSMSSQFPEDKLIYENLISESETHLGKLSSLIGTPEMVDNITKGLEESQEISEGVATESGEEVDWDEDPRMLELRKLVFDRVRNSQVFTEEDKIGWAGELQVESLAECIGFGDGSLDPEETLSSQEKMKEAADNYVSLLEKYYEE